MSVQIPSLENVTWVDDTTPAITAARLNALWAVAVTLQGKNISESSSEVQIKVGNGFVSQLVFDSDPQNQISENTSDIDDLETLTATHASQIAENTSDIKRNTVAIDARIKKFYTTNRNNSNTAYTNHVSDSDDGAVRSLRIYGKSSQGANPSPSNPQTIHSVVNPKLTVCGKNLCEAKCATTTRQGVTLTNLGDGKFRLNGTATNTDGFRIDQSTWSGVNNLKTYNGTYTLSRSDTSYKVGVIQNGSFSNLLTLNYGAASVTGSISNKSNCFICIFYQSGVTYDNVIVDVQLELGSTATAFAPYEANTATLAKTLNAIPVASGGNITIDGQQYIADYVDVERKKLVRMVGSVNMGSIEWYYQGSSGHERFVASLQVKPVDSSVIANLLCQVFVPDTANNTYLHRTNNTVSASDNGTTIHVYASDYTDASIFRSAVNNRYLCYELSTPTEETLTDSQVSDFLAMRSYYPQTNIYVTSDDLDGQATFLYPCSMERFVEYVKEELGDSRETVYDMRDISDQAFINAQYAEILAEMALDD